MQVAIVGLGVMGGSLGLALRERAGAEVVGVDRDPEQARIALERGCVDRVAASIAEACAGADLAVAATPVSSIATVVGEIAAAAEGGTTITDLGSTKAQVVDAVPVGVRDRFVGGHPICGSEAHGAAHARAELFEGATWFLTPTVETAPERLARVHALVAQVGARPVVIDARAHDEIVGLTSHLPHVLANVLALQVADADVDGHRPLDSTGGSFRDMTRVAGANPSIWVDIFLGNRDALLDAVREARDGLDRVAAALEQGDADFLADWSVRAGTARREALALAHRAAPADLHEIIASLPDRPGAISAVAQTLSAAGINIEEFSLSHISPERGGEVRMVVAGAERAARAVELLRADGCPATAEPVGDDAGGGAA